MSLSLSDVQTCLAELKSAARDEAPVAGLTHAFYRYPARFSPKLASRAIELFSEPGDLVLDPFSGGGTTVVEALARGRHAIGTDINELATFVGRLKTARLTLEEEEAVRNWATTQVPRLRYSDPLVEPPTSEASRRNLTAPGVRVIRKLAALALESAPELANEEVRIVVQGAILAVSQWALDGKRVVPSASVYRERLRVTALEMLDRMADLWATAENSGSPGPPLIRTLDARDLGTLEPFRQGTRADLVVTSLPYPGVHVLYHRWQVEGGRETPAPYWISASRDGKGAAYYTMGARNSHSDDGYFSRVQARMQAIREVMKPGAVLVQVVGFSEPRRQLRRYLRCMTASGFIEHRPHGAHRTWREVPGRKWHAVQRSAAPAAREVVLVHIAD
jgi:SAM-dependent methyltransferase